mmetsp:Transcript_12462/g.35676  ORF Transcript_12462/g.35676 Transcript_12462/m.35676 type:complete len:286 (-) Transcript_12462:175-1032(-)
MTVSAILLWVAHAGLKCLLLLSLDVFLLLLLTVRLLVNSIALQNLGCETVPIERTLPKIAVLLETHFVAPFTDTERLQLHRTIGATAKQTSESNNSALAIALIAGNVWVLLPVRNEGFPNLVLVLLRQIKDRNPIRLLFFIDLGRQGNAKHCLLGSVDVGVAIVTKAIPAHNRIDDAATDDGVLGADHHGRNALPPTKADGIRLLGQTEQSLLQNLDTGLIGFLVETVLDVFREALLLVVGADQKDVAATGLEGLGHDKLEETGSDDQDLLRHLPVGGTNGQPGG